MRPLESMVAVLPASWKDRESPGEDDTMSHSQALWARLQADLVRRAESIGCRSRGAGFPTADELAQTTIEKLLETYGRVDLDTWTVAKLYAAAYTTIHRTWLDACRKHRETLATPEPDGGVEMPDSADRRPEPEEEAGAAEVVEQLRGFLRELSSDERCLLENWLALGSAPKAQEACGWPPGGRSNACHALKRIVAKVLARLEKQVGKATLEELLGR